MMYQLEDRILFDGAMATDLNAIEPNDDAQNNAETAEQKLQNNAANQADSANELTPLTQSGAETDYLAGLAGHETPEESVEVLVISEKLWNKDALLDAAKPGTIIVEFDPQKTTAAELVNQIAKALDGKTADRIGFFSGDLSGELNLFADGAVEADAAEQAVQRNFWGALDTLLAEDGQIDLFASNLAQGAEGKAIVDTISSLSGHQVNASCDTTGDADAGGNWVLEYASGNGETTPDAIDRYFDGSLLDTYDHVLADPREVVFVNPSVWNADQLVAQIGSHVEVIRLSADGAFEEVTDYLRANGEIDAIHFLTHGNDGEFLLGAGTQITSEFLTAHAEEFAVWKSALNKDGDILIYGCNVAASEEGKNFVVQLAETLDCDVAASTDRTGYRGNWDLEFTVGHIDAGTLSFTGYNYSLAQWTIHNLNDPVLTSDDAISTKNLSLREAIKLAEDGDTLRFSNTPELLKNTTDHTTSHTIFLQDTLVINTNITIIALTTDSPNPIEITIDASKCKVIIYHTGDELPVDVVLREGNSVYLQVGGLYGSLKARDGNLKITYDATLELTLNTEIQDGGVYLVGKNTAFCVLGGNSVFAPGSSFESGEAYAQQLIVLTGYPSSGNIIGWTLPGDLYVSVDPYLDDATGTTYGAVLYGEDTRLNTVSGILYSGVYLQAGSFLPKGTWMAPGTYINNAFVTQGYVLAASMTVTSTLFVGDGTRVAGGGIIAEGTVLAGQVVSDTSRHTQIGTGSYLGLPAGTTQNTIYIPGGFAFYGEVFASTKSVLGAFTSIRYGYKGQTGEVSDATYIYMGTELYTPGTVLKAGTILQGNITLLVRAFYIDAEADVIWTTSKDTSVTSPPIVTTTEVENTEGLPVGVTTETLEPVVSTQTSTVTTEDGDVTKTSVITTSTTTIVTTVTAPSFGTGTGTVTTETTTETVVRTLVEKSSTSGVIIARMNLNNAAAQAGAVSRPAPGVGAGFFVTSRSQLELQGVDIKTCVADKDGGGIYLAANARLVTTVSTEYSPQVYRTTFTSCVAGQTSVGGSGGAIYNGGRYKMDRTTFSSNFAQYGGSGGAVYSATSNLSIVGSTFTGNSASASGGAIYINANNLQTATLSIYTGVFISNTAGVDGGAIFFTKGNFTQGDALRLDFCDFLANGANNNGGAIYITDSVGKVTIQSTPDTTVEVEEDVTITTTYGVAGMAWLEWNYANGNGGAVAVVNNKGDVLLNLLYFGENFAANNGGAIYVKNSANVSLIDVELAQNTATLDGGAMFISNNNASYTVSVSTSDISENSANRNGGGIYLDLGKLTIVNSTLAYNGDSVYGDNVGGAIYMASGTLSINFCTLAYNYGSGAAIYIGVGNSTLSISNSIIYNDAVYKTGSDPLFTSQIYVDSKTALKYTISTTNNIYSHYYEDLNVARSNTLNLTNGKTVNGINLIAVNGEDSLRIQKTLFLDDQLSYNGSVRTRSLAILHQDSIAYNQIAAAGQTYDQTGNLRVDAKAWTWDGQKWVQGKKTRASIGAMEPIFYLEVTSKGDDEAMRFSYDLSTRYLDKAYANGLTLREAMFWSNSYDGLKRIAEKNRDLYLATGYTDFLNNANKLIVAYTRYYTDLNEEFVVCGFAGDGSEIRITFDKIGYLVDSTGEFIYQTDSAGKFLVDSYGKNIKISTTGNVNFDKTVFKAGQDNTINLAFGDLYVGRDWYIGGYLYGVYAVGGQHDISYRAQNASDRIIVDGNASTNLLSNRQYTTLVVNNLTFTNGKGKGTFYGINAGSGGGISNSGNLTLNNMVVSYCETTVHGDGGGICNAATGKLWLYDSSISYNQTIPTTAVGDGNALGGGIYNKGEVWIERSEIVGNISNGAVINLRNIYAGGGGIWNEGSLHILNSTLTENQVAGTASSNYGGTAIASAKLSTAGTAPILECYNSTITLNSRNTKSENGPGTGIWVTAGEFYLANSIVAENIDIAKDDTSRTRNDVYVELAEMVVTTGNFAGKYNIIGGYNYTSGDDVTGFNWAAGTLHNVTGIHAFEPSTTGGGELLPVKSYGIVDTLRLDFNSFGYNGAKTRTYRLLGGSAAFDSGYYKSDYAVELLKAGLFSVGTDQRGVTRTIDSDGNIATTTNIGSYENIPILYIGSSADSLTHRQEFNYTLDQPLWEAPDLTLREALYLADDGTQIFCKHDWQINGSKRNGTTVKNELDSQGRLIIQAVDEFRIGRDIKINGAYYTGGNFNEGGKLAGVLEIKLASGVSSRIFLVRSYEEGYVNTAALMNMVLTGGKAINTGVLGSGNGGSIYAVANLLLENVSISNATASQYGGGIFASGGTLTLINSSITGSSAIYGGGFYVEATALASENFRVLEMHGSTVSDNKATNTAQTGGSGGGIYIRSGTAVISLSVIGRNKAGGDGGGIYLETGSLEAVNTTVANNTAGQNGGGLFFLSGKYMTLDFMTIANNQSGWTAAGKTNTAGTFYGAGLYMKAGALTLTRSIVAQNYRGAAFDANGYIVTNALNDDIFLTYWANQGHSLTDNVIGANIAEGLQGYLRTVAPENRYITSWSTQFTGALDTKLTDNGGMTQTVHIFTTKTTAATLKFASLAYSTEDVLFDQTNLLDFMGTSTGTRQWVGALEAASNVFVFANGLGWTGDGGLNYRQASDNIFSLQNTYFSIAGEGVCDVAGNLVLSGLDWQTTRNSQLVISDEAVITVHGILAGVITVQDSGSLYIATTSYNGLLLSIETGNTTIGYTAAAAQTIGNFVFDNLVIGGGEGLSKELVKTYTGDLEILGNLQVRGNTLFKVLAATKTYGTGEGNLTFNTAASDDPTSAGKVLTAGNITVTGDKLSGIGLDTDKKHSIKFLSTDITLAGYVTLGSANSLIDVSKIGITVTGQENHIYISALKKYNFDLQAGELILDLGKAAMDVKNTFFDNISADAYSRLKIISTGKLTLGATLNTGFDGTLALDGKITVTTRLDTDAALELSGTVVLQSTSISADKGITISGKVSIKNDLVITSSDGNILLGGTLSADGKFVTGSAISGGSKKLTLNASGDIYIGPLSSVLSLTVESDSNTFLGGDIKAKDTVDFRSEASILTVYDKKGNLAPLKITTSGIIKSAGFRFDGDAAMQSELQLSAGKATSIIESLDLPGQISFMKGVFSYTGDELSAGAIYNKATLSTDMLLMLSGSLTNAGILNVNNLDLGGDATMLNTKTVSVRETFRVFEGAVFTNKSGTVTSQEFHVLDFAQVHNTAVIQTTEVAVFGSSTLNSTKEITAKYLLMEGGSLNATKGKVTFDTAEISEFANISTSATMTVKNLYAENSSVSNNGTLNLNGITEFSGESNFLNTKTIKAPNAITFFDNASFKSDKGSVTVGSMELEEGSLINRGTLKITKGITSAGGLENNGTLTTGTGIIAENLLNTKTIKTTTLELEDFFQNSGSITLSGKTFYVGGAFSNAGTLNAVNANLEVEGAFSNAEKKTVKIASLYVDGRLENRGTLTISGLLEFVGDNDLNNVSGTLTAARITLDGYGTLVNSGTLKATSITQDGMGAFSNHGKLQLDSLTLNGGDLDNTGSITKLKAQRLDMLLDNSFLTNTKTGSISNALITLEGTSGYINLGKFTNVQVVNAFARNSGRMMLQALNDLCKTDADSALDELLAL